MGQRSLFCGPDKGNKAKRSRVVWVGGGGAFKEVRFLFLNKKKRQSGQWLPHVYVSRVVLSRQWQARVSVTPEIVAPQPPYHRRLRCTDCKHLHVNFAVLHCSFQF